MVKDKTGTDVESWSILSKAKKSANKRGVVADGNPASTTDATAVQSSKIKFKRIFLELFFISIFILVIYSPSLHSPFVFVDDYLMHPFASKLREDNFWLELFLKGFLRPLSQPWLTNSFAQDLGYCGSAAVGYRLVSIILHMNSCIYLYILALQIALHFPLQSEIKESRESLSPYKIAFASSLLFACHPFVTQSVAYISGRGGELTGVNCLLALNFFLWAFWSDRAFPVIVGYAGVFFCSLMAIESSVEGLAMPLILFLSAMLLHRPQSMRSAFTERRWEFIILAIFSIWVLISSIFLNYSSEFANNFGMPAPDRMSYLAAQIQGFLDYYLRCAIVPIGMSIAPPVLISPGVFGIATIFCGASILAISAIAWIKRKSPFIAFPLATIIAAYIPSLLILRSDYASDERFYFPTAVICLIVAFAFAKFANSVDAANSVNVANSSNLTNLASVAKDQLTLRNMPTILGLFVVLSLTSLTIWREGAWSSSLSIWKNAVTVNPTEHSRAMVALAQVDGENAEQVKKEAESILKKTPDCLPALLTVAKYEFNRKNHHTAKPFFEKALKLCEEKNADAFCRFQVTTLCLWNLLELGERKIPAEAITYLLQKYPECDDVNYLAGRIALDQNNATLAVRYLDKAFSVNRTRPDYLLALGQACLDTGEPTLIRNTYKSTRKLSMRVSSPELRIIFAQAALELGHPDECLSSVDAAIAIFDKLNYKLRPELKARAFYVRSLALLRLGENLKSEAARNQAFSFDSEIAKKLKIKTVN